MGNKRTVGVLTKLITALAAAGFVAGAIGQAAPIGQIAVQASDGKRELAAGAFVPRIDASDKDAVARAYHHYYYWRWLPDLTKTPQLGWLGFPIASGWTGNVERCEAGTLADNYQVSAIRQANYFRAMAGLSPVIVGKPSEIRQAQAATLVLAANNILTHNIPPTTKCFSQEAADGAAKSNLSAGFSAFTSPNSLDSYVDDEGRNNFTVGHRQWILNPDTRAFAYGDTVLPFTDFTKFAVNGFDAWYVLNGGFERLDSPEYVVWPVAGWNPSQIMPLSNRWSFSCRLCGYDETTVSMTKNGVAMPVPIIEYRGLSGGIEVVVFNPVGVDYGYDAATNKLLGWPKDDATYTVTLRNVKYPSSPLPPQGFTYNGGYAMRDFSYTVKVFDVERYLLSASPVPAINYADIWVPGVSAVAGGVSAPAIGAMAGSSLTLHPNRDNTMMVTWQMRGGGAGGGMAWVTMQNAVWMNKTTLQGRVSAFNGQLRASSAGATLNTVAASARDIGTATIAFQGDNDAMVTYSLDGVSGSFAVKRAVLGEAAFMSGMNFSGYWRDVGDARYSLSLSQQYASLTGQLLGFDNVGGSGAGAGEARSLSLGRCEWGAFDENALLKNAACRATVYDTQRVVGSDGTAMFARKVRGYVSMRFTTIFTAEVTVSMLGAAPSVMKMTREMGVAGLASASKATLLNRSRPESNSGDAVVSMSGFDDTSR